MGFVTGAGAGTGDGIGYPDDARDIRGKGLLIGVELEPAAGKARGFCERLQEVGVLAKETHDVVVRFAPPLIINKNQIDWAMEGIESVFK